MGGPVGVVGGLIDCLVAGWIYFEVLFFNTKATKNKKRQKIMRK